MCHTESWGYNYQGASSEGDYHANNLGSDHMAGGYCTDGPTLTIDLEHSWSTEYKE